MTTTPHPKSSKTPVKAQIEEVRGTEEDGSRLVEFDGVEYRVPSQDDVDLGALEAFEANQIARGVRLLVGDEQYAKFRETHSKMSDLSSFMDALMNTGNS